MNDNTPYTRQAWWSLGSNNAFNDDNICKYWKDDYYVTSAAYTYYGWFFVASLGTGWTDQGYRYSSDWPTDWLREKWDNGYYITSMAASDTHYFLMASQGTDILSQKVCANPDWSVIRDFLHKWWNENYVVAGMCCKAGMWTFLMNYTGTYYQQSVFWGNTADEIATKIKEKWDEDYLITAIEYGNGEFCCVMSKTPGSSGVGQSYFIRTDKKPNDHIKEKWDENYEIVTIGG